MKLDPEPVQLSGGNSSGVGGCGEAGKVRGGAREWRLGGAEGVSHLAPMPLMGK